MELTTSIETINRQLIDFYGIDTVTGQAMWRVVWSEDQFEHRRGVYEDFSDAGLYLRTVEEVRYVPKYRQWIKEKYVLERLVVVPEVNIAELPAAKISYEPLYAFETEHGKYLPPRIDACQFVINTVLAAQGKGSLAKYKDPLSGVTHEEQLAIKNQEIDILQAELFGNETNVGDALAHHSGVSVPHNYKKEN